ncbi:hypothetical protein QE152_g35896 [Popillia japonica]|uniref:Uncharacterized protein n=1 Tax=Popillia japonica TaxID=7064 RepID=A0AAW1IE27_POPJA
MDEDINDDIVIKETEIQNQEEFIDLDKDLSCYDEKQNLGEDIIDEMKGRIREAERRIEGRRNRVYARFFARNGVSYGIEDMSRIEPEIQESKKRATSEWSPQNDNQRKKKTMKMERKN